MKLHLPKGLLVAVLAAFISTQSINAEVITVNTNSSVSNLTAGYTGLIIENATLAFGSNSGSTLADGITINYGGIVTYDGISQSCFAPATVVKVNAGGKLILNGTNDGLGWNPGTVTSLTLEGSEGKTAQLLTMGRITFDAPINLNGYATISLKDGAATSGDNRASLDTWNNCALNVSGVENTINTEFILRKNLTITTAGSSELTVNGTVNSGAVISVNGKETDGVTSGGSVTFKGAYNANGLNVGSSTSVILSGATNVSGTITNNGSLTSSKSLSANAITNNGTLALSGNITANKELTFGNFVLTDATGNTVNAANGYLKSADITNVITGTGTTSLNGSLTVSNYGTTYSIVGTKGNVLTTNFTDKAYAITTDTSYNANDIAVNTTIYVLSGATLDANGTAIEERPIILASGTTLANTGANISLDSSGTDLMQNSKIALTGNATINTVGDMGIIGKGYAESFLTLNGNTLTKTGSGKLYLMNTTVSAGTIDLQQGEIILKQNDSHANGITVNNSTVFNIAKDAQLTFDSSFGTAEAGNIILAATGTGTINTNRDLVINGNTGNNAANSAFAGTINVAGGTLKLGTNATSGPNDGWKLNMTDATIQLNGGNLYFFGKNSNFGDIAVLENATYSIHATENDQKITHGIIDIAKDKTLSMSANWTGKVEVDSVTGEGNLALKRGSDTPNLVLTVGNLQNSGTISLESGTTLNISAGTIYHSITNAGTINFNGAIALDIIPSEAVYTDVDGSTNTGNGFLTSLTYSDLISGGTVSLGDGFAVSYDGSTSATESYSDKTLTATFDGKAVYTVGAGNTVNMTSDIASNTTTAFLVKEGATLNANGIEGSMGNKDIYLYEGAVFTNTGNKEIHNNLAYLNKLVLHGNATVKGDYTFGILANSWGTTEVLLNDNTLTKDGSNTFHLSNSTISAGTIQVNNGTLQILGSTTIDDDTRFELGKNGAMEFAYKSSYHGSLSGTQAVRILNNTTTEGGIIKVNTNVTLDGNTTEGEYTEITYSGTLEVGNGATLSLGSNTTGANSGWKLNMTDATIQLNGGNLYFFGKNSNFGDIDVLQNASYTLHATDEAKVTHGNIDIAKDKTLSMSANWTSNIDIDSITGEGNLALKRGSDTPNLVLTVGNLQNSGTISLESGTTLNISAGTIYHSITNAGTINFNGAIALDIIPSEVVYTDVDGSTNTGNGFLTRLTYSGLITGNGSVTLGEGFAVSHKGNTSTEERYNSGTLTATFADNSVYYVMSNTPTAMTSGMADLLANSKTISVENGATLTVGESISLNVNGGNLNIATGGTVQYSTGRDLTALMKATHGTGDVVLQSGGTIFGTGTGTSLDFEGNLIVTGGTLNYADVDNYFHGYCLQMGDGTVTLQGGSVRAFGTNMVIGKVVADATSGVSTFTVHQANPVINQNQKTANGLSIGTLQLNSGMVLDANWNTDVHTDILTGEGDLNVYYNRTNGSSNTGTMNVSIGNVQDYSGVITLGAKTNGDVTNADRLFVTIGTADSSSTISNSIINHAALTLQGDIIIDANGNYAIYNPDTITDREGSFSYSTQSGFFTAENLQYYLVVGGQNTLNCDSVTQSDGSTTTLQNISGAGVIFTSSTSTTTQEFFIGETLNYGDLLANTQSGVTVDTAFIINGGTLVLQKGESLNGALLSVSDNGGSIELKAGATLTNAQNSAASLIGTGKAEMTFDTTYNATIATTDAFTGSVEVKSGNFEMTNAVDSLSSLTLGSGVNFQISTDTVVDVDLVLNGDTEAHQNSSKNLTLNGKVSGNGTYTRKAHGELTFNGEVDLAGFDQTHQDNVKTVFNKKADIDTVKVGKGDVQFNKGGEFNKAAIVEGNIQLAGGTYNIAIVDASEGNNATGRFTIKEKAIVNVSDKLWKSNQTDSAIQLEKDAQLNVAGISIRGTDNINVATLTNTISDASNSNDLYGTAHAHFEISNANVVVTGNDDIELGNKLTSSSLIQSGTGLVTITHEDNSLTELFADKGKINIQNCDELNLNILTIAEGQAIGVHSGTEALKEAQGEATITVISSACFDRGAELYANLVLQSGAELISKGTLTLGSDLTLQTGLTLSGNQYKDILQLATTGGEVVLVDGIDSLYLGLGADASADITLAHQVKANTYFTNLDDSFVLVYDTSAGEGKGKLSITTAVPEPTTATLSLLALMALAARRRRR